MGALVVDSEWCIVDLESYVKIMQYFVVSSNGPTDAKCNSSF